MDTPENTDKDQDFSESENPEWWKDQPLFNADLNCKHHIVELWSGVKCTKCGGWFCY